MPAVSGGVCGCCREKVEPSFLVLPELKVNIAALINVDTNQAKNMVPNYLYRL